VYCEDVSRLTIDTLEAPEGDPIVAFRKVRVATVRGCVPAEKTKVFLNVAGPESRAISLLANDFSGAEKVVAFSDGALPESVGEVGNRK
jgi:hypothetical protein